jgi:peptidoglycan/LPS O-acetylase OafA/YrhL
MILTGLRLPILGQPELGVDLFMYLSGFLMVYQYNIRKEKEDWDAPATWMSFWVRRFFRLSPLYFLLLAIALIFGNDLYEQRTLIDQFHGNRGQAAERFTDTSATNILTHLTYTYGLIPKYAYRTALPDWSLTLEMQFYAVFPFLVFMARKTGWNVMIVSVAGISIAIALWIHYLGVSFPMPSFLPLKMHMFLAGMVVAIASGPNRFPLFFLALLLAMIPGGGSGGMFHLVARAVILSTFFVLVHLTSVSLIDRISRLLGSLPFHWLGELSYGVYLMHLLVLHSVAVWAIGRWGSDVSPVFRFAFTFSIVAAVCYAASYITYRLVERPGQSLGRYFLTTLGRKGQARQTSAEEIAAP